MTAPETAGRAARARQVLCQGGVTHFRPQGHAPASVRVSYRLAGEVRTRLFVLCDCCAAGVITGITSRGGSVEVRGFE